MELLVASWTIRIAIIAALAVGGASYLGGTSAITAVDRAMAAAVLFTFAGRWLVGFLEPPERRLSRMRQKREARRAKTARAANRAVAVAAAQEPAKRKSSTAASAQKA